MVEVDDDRFPINQEVPNYIELLNVAVPLGRDQQVETEDINQSKLEDQTRHLL